MKPHTQSLLVLTLIFAGPAVAGQFEVSPDGSAVVRLTPVQTVPASTFDTNMLTNGYTGTTATSGSLSVTGFDAGFKSTSSFFGLIKGSSGGGQITALFNRNTTLGVGQRLEWIQVGNDNAPIPGYPSPYLDSSAASSPFYTFTAANRNPSLAANQLNFYDYSRRAPETLKKVNPVNWKANLYPVVVDNNKNIQVFDGVSWGWTMKKATVGTTSGTFLNPSPSTAVVSGVGTSNFSWGSGEPGSLSFAGQAFDTAPGKKFTLGHLTYHNGTTVANTEATSVDFEAAIKFDNVPEKNFSLKETFNITNTPNTADPKASADSVSIGNFGFTFNVLEGQTASVDLLATLSSNLTTEPGGLDANSAVVPGPFDPSPTYILNIVGLANPSAGGFITGIPEPSTVILTAIGIFVLSMKIRFA